MTPCSASGLNCLAVTRGDRPYGASRLGHHLKATLHAGALKVTGQLEYVSRESLKFLNLEQYNLSFTVLDSQQ